ncbi:MAG: acylphosphatase [Gammaproteobacteria bacterium]|nr:acylphosphatase [Gammaproteobacteria bacterium]
MRTVRLIISGRVQGVYFRRFTKHKAHDLGINGTVCNRADGSVEIIAQAEAGKLEPFIKWCHKGPITARVDKVEIKDLDGSHPYQSFEII